MKFKLEIPEFEENDIILYINFFGHKKIAVDGIFLRQVNGLYNIKKHDGQNIPIHLRQRWFELFPHIEVGLHRIDVVAPLRWYEYAGVCLPLLLIYFSPFFGGLFGVVGLYILARVFHSSFSAIVKFSISAAYVLFTFVLMIVSVLVLRSSIDMLASLEYRNRIIPLEKDVHHDTHYGRVSIVLSKDMPVDRYGYPAVHLDKLGLRKLLKERKYRELNDTLNFFQRLFEKDFRYEYLLSEAFFAFYVSDSSLLRPMEAWKNAYPMEFQPHTARALMKVRMGWDSRGTKFASETPAENFIAMEHCLSEAKENAFAANAANPRSPVPYEALLFITLLQGNHTASEYITEQALGVCPCLYRVRERYMMNLLPRWGGSYEDMDNFAEEAQTYKNINPKLHVLQGFSLWDQGRMSEVDSMRNEALQYYNAAFQFGECYFFLNDRGDNYWRMDRYAESLADFNRALYYTPQDPDVLTSKAKVLYQLGEIDESLKYLDSATVIDPFMKYEILEWKEYAAQQLVIRGYQFYKSKYYDDAIQQYNLAVRYHHTYALAFFYRGVVFADNQRYSEGIEDFRTAIKYDPHNIDPYIYLDWCWTQSSEWGAIIRLWNSYIALEPNNGRAYRERSGAEYKNGEIGAAIRDLQKGCELHDEESCRLLPQVKNGTIK